MGGHSHEHEHHKFQVPDWKNYQIKGIEELEKTQRLLASRGLKDPWLRNEVWRYSPENYGGQLRNAAISLGRGLKWALAAMAVTIIADKVFHFSGRGGKHH